MKIKGKTIQPPKPVLVAIPREDGDDIIFHCAPVMDYSEFEKLNKRPVPPVTMGLDGTKTPNVDDQRFQIQHAKWWESRMDWMYIQSLRSTPGLEWSTVKYDDPSTWSAYEDELRKCFTENEVYEIMNGVQRANMPDASRQKEALDVFARGGTAPADEATSQNHSQTEEQETTKSGEPASDSESDPQE